jgi:formate/nitrite transporter FocA (FNT family)
MTTQLPQPPAPAERALRWAAILFAVGWGVHVIDHLRRGMSASPHAIMVGGMIQGVFVVIAIWMALTGRDRAPEWAMGVGFGSAILFTYAHILPSYFPAYQDSFVSGPRINVTWFSWVSAVAEIGTGLVFAVAGLRARRRSGVASVVPLRREVPR